MPDMRDAMRNAGLGGASRSGGQRPDRGRGDRPTPAAHDTGSGRDPSLPVDYPRYFTADGYLRPEMVQAEAARIAQELRDARLTAHQLRAFYGHAKRQLQRLRYGADFAAVRPEVAKLESVAAYRSGRDGIPALFKRFIDCNINAVQSEKDFREGFMPHFEAVVAYCANLRER